MTAARAASGERLPEPAADRPASGADLHLELPAGGARRTALARALRDAVRGGRLAGGTLLPPVS
ncbi:hypothetical protein, partial [Streptomyces sp. NPDC058612]|uniref:hypothetical protein n=1 Tax=Streptomyces sp. NPDC058612 TaxID=3346555 RepID=UPI00364F9A59